MPRTAWYAAGSNLFSQYGCSTPKDSSTPIRVHLEDGQDIVDVTPSQVILVSNSTPPKYSIRGFDSQDITLSSKVACIDSFLSNHDSLQGYLGNNGVLYSFSPGESSKNSYCRFKFAAMGVHGDIIAVPLAESVQESPLLLWFNNLDSLLKLRDLSSVEDCNIIPLLPELESAHPIEIIRVVGGAGHFLIELAIRNREFYRLYAWGDNRFGQLGSSSSNTSTAKTESCTTKSLSSPVLVGLFTLQEPFVHVCAGDLHSSVITQDGALYLFGHDGQAQCGGKITGHGEVELVNDSFEENTDESMVASVDCGSSHTIAVVDGNLWATGTNHCGQLCIGSEEAIIKGFSKSPFFNGNVVKVLCSRYTTYIECYEK